MRYVKRNGGSIERAANAHILPKSTFPRFDPAPILLRAGVSAGAIADRIDAGESVTDLAEDYGLSPAEIEEAVLYERAACGPYFSFAAEAASSHA